MEEKVQLFCSLRGSSGRSYAEEIILSVWRFQTKFRIAVFHIANFCHQWGWSPRIRYSTWKHLYSSSFGSYSSDFGTSPIDHFVLNKTDVIFAARVYRTHRSAGMLAIVLSVVECFSSFASFFQEILALKYTETQNRLDAQQVWFGLVVFGSCLR